MSALDAFPYPQGGSELSLATLPGAPDGMGRYFPQHQLTDTEAWTLVDVLLNIPGFTRRRGPLEESPSTGHTSSRSIGLARAQDPAGVEQVIKLIATTVPAGAMKGIINATLDYAWPYTPAISPYELFDSKDMLKGGALIGTASGYDNPTNKALALYRGAGKSQSAASAVSPAVAIGDLTVAVASGTNFCSGHFLFGTSGTPDQLIGVVRSVSGNTLTLEHPALAAEATSVYGTPFRGINPRVSTGRITTATSSDEVNGGNTKFKAQGLGSGTWDIYTPDFTHIGTVTSVESDTQLTLTANAAVALLNSDYIAIKRTGDYSLTTGAGQVGFLNAQYAGHQFYAIGNKIAYSDDDDPEAVDLTENGGTLEFSSQNVRALVPATSGLVAISETEAHALLGAVGTTPDRWRGDRIHDDGTICGMSAVTYQGGVIWAGKRGIWHWDGGDPQNIVAKLGDDYGLFVKESTRAWGMIVRDHYFLHVETGASGVFAKVKNQTTTNLTRLTFIVNLETGACSIATNVGIRGAVDVPASLVRGTSLFAITTDAPASRVMKGDSLFLDDGTDAYTCENDTIGPDFYVETKKYDMGDPQRLKLFKILLLHYISTGAKLKLDTVKGLGTTGEQAASDFAISASFINRRLKFMKRSQFLAFRLYQDTSSTTRVTLGPWALAFKWKRPGRP